MAQGLLLGDQSDFFLIELDRFGAALGYKRKVTVRVLQTYIKDLAEAHSNQNRLPTPLWLRRLRSALLV